MKVLAKIIIRLEGITLIINTIITLILSHKINKLLELPNNKKVVKQRRKNDLNFINLINEQKRA